MCRLDSQLKQKLLTLMGHKNALTQETEQLENLLSEIDQYLNGKTRSELIAKAPELLQLAMEINRKPSSSLVVTAASGAGPPGAPPLTGSDFQSEIVPMYETATFALYGFSQLQNKVGTFTSISFFRPRLILANKNLVGSYCYHSRRTLSILRP